LEKIPEVYEDHYSASTAIDDGLSLQADLRAETPLTDLCPPMVKESLVQEDYWQAATEPPPDV